MLRQSQKSCSQSRQVMLSTIWSIAIATGALLIHPSSADVRHVRSAGGSYSGSSASSQAGAFSSSSAGGAATSGSGKYGNSIPSSNSVYRDGGGGGTNYASNGGYSSGLGQPAYGCGGGGNCNYPSGGSYQGGEGAGSYSGGGMTGSGSSGYGDGINSGSFASSFGGAGGFPSGFAGLGNAFSGGFPNNAYDLQNILRQHFIQMQDFHNKVAAAGGSGTGGQGGSDSGIAQASASGLLGPNGGWGIAKVSPPAEDGLGARFGAAAGPVDAVSSAFPVPSGAGESGIFTSSSSGSETVNGQTKTYKTATVGVNDNGKVTTYTAHNP